MSETRIRQPAEHASQLVFARPARLGRPVGDARSTASAFENVWRSTIGKLRAQGKAKVAPAPRWRLASL